MKICLISPTWSVPIGFEDRIRVPYPIGLIQIGAVLEKAGHKIDVIDALAEDWKRKTKAKDLIIIGMDDDKLIEKIQKCSPDIIAIGSLFTSQRDNLIRISKKIKDSFNVPLLAGGVDPSIQFEDCLNETVVDYIVVGEADFSFLELIKCLEKKGDVSKVKGIAFRKDGKNIFTGNPEPIKDLNVLPMPAYHLLDFKKYFAAGQYGLTSRGLTVNRWMSIFTSRGCPYKCNFCSIHLMSGRIWRGKSAEKVVSEIEHLYNKYGIKYFFFEDDNLTANIKRAEDIFDGIIKKKLKIKWETPNGVRADRITHSLVRKMKKSGCKKLILGIENGDQEFLKNVIHKNLDLKKVVVAVKIIKKYDIEMGGFFIIGIPGENFKVMVKSILFGMRLAMHGLVPGFTLATPLPKTELYEIAQRNGYLVKDPITPKDYLTSYSEPLMTTENFTYKQLMLWKKIATLLTASTLFAFHPGELFKTNTMQEIKKHPHLIFKKIFAVLRGST